MTRQKFVLTLLNAIAAIGLQLGGTARAAGGPTVCSLTFNSSDEIAVMKDVLEPQGFRFIELVPPTKNPNWFRAQCEAGVRCDIVVASGHFGGLFFGEKISSTLSLGELEHARCNQTCDGILSQPKEVFLFGCNTLANKTRDHRTLTQYLNVLINDGLPMDFAEQVAASRYSGLGWTLEARFANVFQNSTKIYGFASTGPLGRAAAPRLRTYFEQVGDYQKHLTGLSSTPNQSLAKSFAGTSFRETSPSLTTSPQDRALSCALQQSESEPRARAFSKVVGQKRTASFFDALVTHISSFGEGFWPEIDLAQFERTLTQLKTQTRELVTLQAKVIRLQEAMHFINAAEKDQALKRLIQTLWSTPASYPRVTQTCAIAANELALDWLSPSGVSELLRSPLTFLTLSCFGKLDQSVIEALQSQLTRPRSSDHEQLARFALAKVLNRPSLLLNLEKENSLTRCASRVQNSMFDGSPAWACLEQNAGALSIGACEAIARKNPDDENADDMRWYCWDQLRASKSLSRAQCFQLASSMRILGNRMKAVWNCTHDL